MEQEREFFHDIKRLKERSVCSFIEHAKDYVIMNRTIPVSQARSITNQDITFTFIDSLLQRLVETGDRRIKKDYEVALKYGFRGYSAGGKNGIFLQNKKDSGLSEPTDKLVSLHLDEIVADLGVVDNDVDLLKKVKIVSHDPSGKRMVGVYNPNIGRMLFLGYANH
jgi:hypothetical protein